MQETRGTVPCFLHKIHTRIHSRQKPANLVFLSPSLSFSPLSLFYTRLSESLSHSHEQRALKELDEAAASLSPAQRNKNTPVSSTQRFSSNATTCSWDFLKTVDLFPSLYTRFWTRISGKQEFYA